MQYRILNLTDPYGPELLHPVVLFGKTDMVLVDCGYPGSLPQLEAQMDLNRLTMLVLTHQDDDHMGAAAQLKAAYPHILIAAMEAEAPYISGAEKNLRLKQAEAMQPHLPPEQRPWGEAFCRRLSMVQPVAVDVYLHPGETFPWAGGCRTLATPGHTPGHLSVYLTEENVLICGDAAVIESGRLAVANSQFCLDLPRAKETLEAIRQLSCRSYICYHGGILDCQLASDVIE